MESQKSQLMITKNHLRQVSPDKECVHGEIGALIISDKGRYYISVGIGKLMIDEEVYYAISPEAPLSKLMINKKAGDQVSFRDRKFEILEVQ